MPAGFWGIFLRLVTWVSCAIGAGVALSLLADAIAVAVPSLGRGGASAVVLGGLVLSNAAAMSYVIAKTEERSKQ